MILVVDDDPNVRTFISTIIENLSCEVIAAENGKQAIKLCKEHHPSMIFTDSVMPVMNRLKMRQQLNIPENPPVIVAMISDIHGCADDYLNLPLAIGAIAILQKPLTPQDIQQAVLTLYPRHVGNQPASQTISI